MLDISRARGLFPALSDELAYFENAGGSLVAQPVIETLRAYLSDCPVQPAWEFAASRESKRRIELGLDAAATLLNCRISEVVVSHSTTINLNTLSHCLSSSWKPGDCVVITEQDHEANRGCWLRLASKGFEVRVWKVDPSSGELNVDDLRALLDDRVRLVACTHVSNVVGSINPVREIADLVHSAGAQLCVDGVAFAPHRRVDVKALDVDYYVFSTYKTFGPHAGVMFVREECQTFLGSENHSFLEGIARVNPGGKQYDLVAALAGIPAYLKAIGATDFDAFAEQEERLCESLMAFLRSRSDLRVLGSSAADRQIRVPTVAFTSGGLEPKAVASALAKKGVAVGASHFYAPACLRAMGVDADRGAVRVSMVHYNTIEEVDRLTRALSEILP